MLRVRSSYGRLIPPACTTASRACSPSLLSACGLRAAVDGHVSYGECTWNNEVRSDATSWDQLCEAVRVCPTWKHHG